MQGQALCAACALASPCQLSYVLAVQVPDHSRAEDIPVVMPQKQYSTLGNAAKSPSPPIAWKLNAPRDVSKSMCSRLLCHHPSCVCLSWVLLGCVLEANMTSAQSQPSLKAGHELLCSGTM